LLGGVVKAELVMTAGFFLSAFGFFGSRPLFF
jgi:hypothetical protein